MNYNEFLETIKTRAKKAAGEDGTVTINQVVKNNDSVKDALVIMEKGYKLSPYIYLNKHYRNYADGISIDEIMSDILCEYYENRDRVVIRNNLFESFETEKNRIAFKLINYDKNINLLKSIPHKKFLDLAIVYYCVIENDNGRNITASISNTHMDKWNIDLEELDRTARINTPLLYSYEIKSIQDMLYEGTGNPDFKEQEDNDRHILVLTNKSRYNGASCILYDKLLKNICSVIKNDLYIIPSSIHETILVEKKKFDNKNELSEMVCEINKSDLKEEDILSDHIYEYDYSHDKISI